MDETNQTPDNRNAESPSSTASGGSSSIRDMGKALAMSVFSGLARKRKQGQVTDVNASGISANDDEDCVSQTKSPRLSSTDHASDSVYLTLNNVEDASPKDPNAVHGPNCHVINNPLHVNTSSNSLKTPESSSSQMSKTNEYVKTRSSPILQHLLHTNSTAPASNNISKSPDGGNLLKALLKSKSPNAVEPSNTHNSNGQSHAKAVCLPKKNGTEEHLNGKDTILLNSSDAMSLEAKKPQSMLLSFLCCFSTLVLKPPAQKDATKIQQRFKMKPVEQYVSYVCYAFDKGTLMCNKGAPTEKIKNILLSSKDTGRKIPCTFLYKDSSLKRKSYNRFLISMGSQGWEVDVQKPGTARDVLQYIRDHEAFFLPDQGLSKVMSYVRQNYNGVLIKETIPMIEGEKFGRSGVSGLRPYDLQKIGDGKDCYLLRSCSVKKQQSASVIKSFSQTPTTSTSIPPTPSLKKSVASTLYPSPALSLKPIPAQPSIHPTENIQITVLPDPGRGETSETLILPSMGGATITLHSASSQVVDTSFDPRVQIRRDKASAAPLMENNTPNIARVCHNNSLSDEVTTTLNVDDVIHPRTSSSSKISNSPGCDIRPEDIPIVDAQYPLLNEEQQKKVTSCSTCGVSFSLIAEKLLHYTENMTCMKVITEKYKFFQPENNFYSIVAADIEQTARSNPETIKSLTYPCSACDSVTKKSIFGYCWHRDRHRPFTIRLFVCSICTAMFRTPYNYVNHSCFSQNTNTKNVLREEPLTTPHKMQKRETGVSDSSEFSMYCQLSTQLRNFFLSCPIDSCGKTFIYISGLLGHLRTHQTCLSTLLGDTPPSDLETGKVTLEKLLITYCKTAKSNVVLPSYQDSFPCETCTEISTSPLAYMLHRDHHKLKDNESRLLCKVCEELFVTPCAFYNHNCATKKPNGKSGKTRSTITWCIFCARLENLQKISTVPAISNIESESEKTDEGSSDIQIVNVRSLSSVLNMYLPDKFVSTVHPSTLSITKNNSIQNKTSSSNAPKESEKQRTTDKNQQTIGAVGSSNSFAKTAASTSLVPEDRSLAAIDSKSRGDVNSKEESVILKIANLNSSAPYVTSLSTSGKPVCSDKAPPVRGRIKVKSVRDLMEIPPETTVPTSSICENIASTSSPTHTKHSDMGPLDNEENRNITSEPLRISASFSLSKTSTLTPNGNEKNNGVVSNNMISGESNNEESGYISTTSNSDNGNLTLHKRFPHSPRKDFSNVSELLPGSTSNETKITNESNTLKRETADHFDREDCYICMDCQPLKLIKGLNLTNHCLDHPTHSQIKHLEDFNKLKVVLDKLRNKDIQSRKYHLNWLTLVRHSSASSNSSGSENASGSGLYLKKSKKNRKYYNIYNFESSDTGTDAEDVSLNRLQSRKRGKKFVNGHHSK